MTLKNTLKRCDFRLDYKKSNAGYLYYTDVKPTDLIAQAYYQLATKLSHLQKNVDGKNVKNAIISSNVLELTIDTAGKHVTGSPKIEDTRLDSEKNYWKIQKN